MKKFIDTKIKLSIQMESFGLEKDILYKKINDYEECLRLKNDYFSKNYQVWSPAVLLIQLF